MRFCIIYWRSNYVDLCFHDASFDSLEMAKQSLEQLYRQEIKGVPDVTQAYIIVC